MQWCRKKGEHEHEDERQDQSVQAAAAAQSGSRPALPPPLPFQLIARTILGIFNATPWTLSRPSHVGREPKKHAYLPADCQWETMEFFLGHAVSATWVAVDGGRPGTGVLREAGRGTLMLRQMHWRRRRQGIEGEVGCLEGGGRGGGRGSATVGGIPTVLEGHRHRGLDRCHCRAVRVLPS